MSWSKHLFSALLSFQILHCAVGESLLRIQIIHVILSSQNVEINSLRAHTQSSTGAYSLCEWSVPSAGSFTEPLSRSKVKLTTNVWQHCFFVLLTLYSEIKHYITEHPNDNMWSQLCLNEPEDTSAHLEVRKHWSRYFTPTQAAHIVIVAHHIADINTHRQTEAFHMWSVCQRERERSCQLSWC